MPLVLAFISPALLGMAQLPEWKEASPAIDGPAGALTALADITGDGIPELAGGWPDATGPRAGGFIGIYDGATGARRKMMAQRSGSARSGAAITTIPDLNRDGFPDLLVGAPLHHGQIPISGTVQAYSGLTGIPLLSFQGQEPYSEFGASVASPGDWNGDGFPDILIGAPSQNIQGQNRGAVFCYSGNDGSLLHRIDGVNDNGRFGSALCVLSDTTGDGLAEIAVSAPHAGPNQTGEVQVLTGGSLQPLRVFRGSAPNGGFGAALASGGDLTGDGHTDLLVGSPRDGSGTAFAFRGQDGVLIHHWQGSMAQSRFGASISQGGDLDRDGVPDVVIGAPRDHYGGLEAGRVQAYSGKSGILLLTRVGQPEEQLGLHLAPSSIGGAQPGYLVGSRKGITCWRGLGGRPVGAPVPLTPFQQQSVHLSQFQFWMGLCTAGWRFPYYGSWSCSWWYAPYPNTFNPWSCPPWWSHHGTDDTWFVIWFWNPCWSCGYWSCCCHGGGSGGGDGGSGGTSPPGGGPPSPRPILVDGGSLTLGTPPPPELPIHQVERRSNYAPVPIFPAPKASETRPKTFTPRTAKSSTTTSPTRSPWSTSTPSVTPRESTRTVVWTAPPVTTPPPQPAPRIQPTPQVRPPQPAPRIRPTPRPSPPPRPTPRPSPRPQGNGVRPR
ncbi:MAG: FG-GAP-like repeat-containing protein [Planctomycetes bacterium]|nr:FG-GAP-like repeat-containing protein [Planctomycetota bacterium]